MVSIRRSVKAVVRAVAEDVFDLLVVDAAHDDGIDANRGEADRACRRDAAQHLVEIASGHLLEDLGAQAVEADIEPAHAGTIQRLGERLHAGAVAGDGEIVEAGQGGQAGSQLGQVAPHQRLAAGDAHTADPQRGEGADDAGDLFEVEPVLGLLEPLEAFRQAIAAAQVAAVGDGQAQVRDTSAKGVGEGLVVHAVIR
jgi:hypothetical protein